MTAGAPYKLTWLFFLDMVVMIVVARFVSYWIYRVRMPRIVGDIIAGCLLGPTVLQDFTLTLFPMVNRPALKMVGYLGLILASASSGAGFDRRVLVGREWKVLLFSVANIGVTFASCYGLLKILPTTPAFHGPNYNPTSYEIYVGSAIASTSLPMTFLILDELKLTNSLAKFCIGTSTVATIILFTMASIANSYAKPDKFFGEGYVPYRISVLIGMITLLVGIQQFWQVGLRKNWRFRGRRWFARLSTDQSVIILCLCLLSAILSEFLGYTYVLGAFLAGALLPVDEIQDKPDGEAFMIRTNIAKLVKYVSRWILLPLFFLDIGLHFDIRYINGDWGYVVLCLVWGFFFKFLMVPISYYGLGFSFNDSCFCASIANCRGFNALVIGSAALDAGQFGETMFATAVLFSVLSSSLAGFLCRVFHEREVKRLASLGGRAPSMEKDAQHLPTGEDDAENFFAISYLMNEDNINTLVPVGRRRAHSSPLPREFIADRTFPAPAPSIHSKLVPLPVMIEPGIKLTIHEMADLLTPVAADKVVPSSTSDNHGDVETSNNGDLDTQPAFHDRDNGDDGTPPASPCESEPRLSHHNSDLADAIPVSFTPRRASE